MEGLWLSQETRDMFSLPLLTRNDLPVLVRPLIPLPLTGGEAHGTWPGRNPLSCSS